MPTNPAIYSRFTWHTQTNTTRNRPRTGSRQQMGYSFSCVYFDSFVSRASASGSYLNHVLDWTLRRSTGDVRGRQLQILIARLRQQHCHRPYPNISADCQWVPTFRPSRLCTSFPTTYLRNLGQRTVVPQSRHRTLLCSSSNPPTALGSSIPPHHPNSMRNPQARPPSRLLR